MVKRVIRVVRVKRGITMVIALQVGSACFLTFFVFSSKSLSGCSSFFVLLFFPISFFCVLYFFSLLFLLFSFSFTRCVLFHSFFLPSFVAFLSCFLSIFFPSCILLNYFFPISFQDGFPPPPLFSLLFTSFSYVVCTFSSFSHQG